MIVFANNTTAVITSGGTAAPAPGTTETWTAASSGFPQSLTAGQSFHVADIANFSEKILVTAISGTGPYTWTVIRGDEGTAPVPHQPGFTVEQVVTAGDFTALDGIVVSVPLPAGVAGTDTANITAAITKLGAALAAGPATLQFADGTYVIDCNSAVISSLSNFAVRGTGATVIQLAVNRSGQYNTNGDLFVIADCTDFSVQGIRFDWNRDTAAPITPLSASASSGQPSVAVAAGNGARYLAGQRLQLYGGLGSAEQAQADTGPSGAGMTISSVTPGGGSGGGDLITFSTNLGHAYAQISASLDSDGLGPYAGAGAYLSPYQTGSGATVAGRTLGNEDTQNGLHLLNCQRFLIADCEARNTWESPLKLGTGFASSSATDGCSQGIITGCRTEHGYDQGISAWNSQDIAVTGNTCQAAGWAGISLTHCNDSTVTGNVCTGNIYTPASDLNEGSGIAVEGGVRCVVSGNVCSGNNSNGIRLNISPMFGGAALSQGVSGTPAAGATTITLTGTNSNFVSGASFTIVDPGNSMIRETIYCAGSSGTTVTLSVALRNSYASGPTIFARFGQDVLIADNTCARQALAAGISANQQIGLKVFANDCSENGFLNGAYADTLGTYGIHLGGGPGYCQEAVVEANTCSYNSQEGIVVDNKCQAVQVLGNSCGHNGIKGTNQKQGIKLYGLTDGTISGNECDFNTQNGIYTQDGDVTTARLDISGNTCLYNNTSGIWLDNGGATCTLRGNKIGFNGDAGMKILGYSSCVFEGNECYNQAGQEGIRLDDGTSSRFCTNNFVTGNLLFDDQGSPSQSWGIRTLNGSAGNYVAWNRFSGNTNSAQLSLTAADSAFGNNVSGTPGISQVGGNLDVTAAGSGLRVAEGSNAKQGTAVLSSGSVVVSNTSVTANSRIFLMSNADGGTPGWLRVSARSAGTSFTITSSSGTDTSTVAYEIFEPG